MAYSTKITEEFSNKPVNPEYPSLWKSTEGDIYLLAQVDWGGYCLVDLGTGNRFHDPVENTQDVFRHEHSDIEFSPFYGTIELSQERN